MDTFVPAPLPPTIRYDDIAMDLSRADIRLSELSGAGRQLPNPNLLIRPYLGREAVLSTRIEGTNARLEDMMLDEVGEGDESEMSAADRQEVRNYIEALELGIAELQKGRPITLNLVLDLHAVLMDGVRGRDKSPGRFRRIQNWIGGRRPDGSDAVFVPPPPELLDDCLSDWERFVNERNTLPDLVQCALMHEQFEAIHPFIDGNGRMGRLLITLFLIERERLSQPLLYLSSYIDASRESYYDLLQGVRTDGDWTSWIRYFLNGVEQTASEAFQQTADLLDLRETLRAGVTGRGKAMDLVDYLFSNPVVTASTVQKALGTSPPTAYSVISALEKADILTKVGHGKRGRRWISLPIAEILLRATPAD
jgi:Fic family protein